MLLRLAARRAGGRQRTVAGERAFRHVAVQLAEHGLGDRLLEPDLALHLAKILDLFVRDQRHDQALGAGPGGATRTVHVRLVVFRRVVVDDRGDAVDVDAAGGDVGGDECVHTALLEVVEGPVALALAASTMDRRSGEAELVELLGEAVGAVTGATEDDRRPGGVDDLGHDRVAVGLVDLPEAMRGGLDVGGLLADLVAHRIALIVAGELGDVTVERCREQHGLTIRRGLVEQTADGGHESHVGHAVGLVEHDLPDVTQVDVTALDQVFEAARAGHQDVDAALEGAQLPAVTDTAVDGVDAHVAGEAAQLGRDLLGELTSRGEHQRDRAPWRRLTERCRIGNERHAEREGLTRAGRCSSAHIATGEAVGDGCGLDFEGFVDPATTEGVADERGNAQLGEGGGHDVTF